MLRLGLRDKVRVRVRVRVGVGVKVRVRVRASVRVGVNQGPYRPRLTSAGARCRSSSVYDER